MGVTIPARLGRYVIEEEIGRGMMGAVYRAADPVLGRTVALKTVRLAFPVSDRERDQFQQRFLVEARAAGALSHPNIVVVHDVGRDSESGTLFIALEYLEGRTIEQVTAEGPMEWQAALRLAAHLADALHHAHSRGIIHRDIKPANIMVLPDGEPKIMDFGIAKLPASQLTVAGQFFGTPAYTAPEQVIGTTVDGRADLFALGAILHLLLTGQRAFTGSSVPAIVASVQSKDPLPPSSLVEGLPQTIDYVVQRALAKDVETRYPDGRTLSEDLEDVREGREPRHREGWEAPALADATVASAAGSVPPNTQVPVDLPSEALQPAPRARPASAGSTGIQRSGPQPSLRAQLVPRAVPARSRQTSWVVVALGSAAALAILIVGGAAFWLGSWSRTNTARAPGAETTEVAGQARPSSEPAQPPADAAEPTAPGVPLLPSFLQPDAPAASGSSLLPTPEPASALDIDLEHSLKSGRFRVWLDDELVVDEPLRGRVKQKILVYKRRRGRMEKTLEIEPGDHSIIVRVDSGGDVMREGVSARFESGKTRHLVVEVGGLLRKRLRLSWAAS